MFKVDIRVIYLRVKAEFLSGRTATLSVPVSAPERTEIQFSTNYKTRYHVGYQRVPNATKRLTWTLFINMITIRRTEALTCSQSNQPHPMRHRLQWLNIQHKMMLVFI